MTTDKFRSLSHYHTLNFSLSLPSFLSLSILTSTCQLAEMPKLKLLCASTALQGVISLSETKLMSFENYLSLSYLLFVVRCCSYCCCFCFCWIWLWLRVWGLFGNEGYSLSLAANNFARRIHVACYKFLRFYYTIYYWSRSLSTCESPNPTELGLGEEIVMKPRLSLIGLECASPVPYNPRTCPYLCMYSSCMCKYANLLMYICKYWMYACPYVHMYVCIRSCLLRLLLIGFFGA